MRVKLKYVFKDGETHEVSVHLDNMNAFDEKDFLTSLIEGRKENKDMMLYNRVRKSYADLEKVEISFEGF